MDKQAISRSAAHEPRFVVLMATHNGEKHLAAQLGSLAAQTVSAIDILASDDASTDDTRDMLARAAAGWRRGAFEVVAGPGAGFSENFRSLILRAGDNADYYAFCDQDDIWEEDKLSQAMQRIGGIPDAVPALYCGATWTMAEDESPIGRSPTMRRPPSFRNALVQSIAGGNTMVMNRAAFRLLQEASDGVDFVSHDWWAYLVVSGAGGIVVYDPVPRVGYRQHGMNLVGANTGPRARLRRLHLLASGRWFDWLEKNLSALTAKQHLLTEDNRRILHDFVAMRTRRNPVERISRLRSLRLYRQSGPGNLSMMIAVALRKF